MSKCFVCGDTGYINEGTVCTECNVSIQEYDYEAEAVSIFIPEKYIANTFTHTMVNPSLGTKYPAELAALGMQLKNTRKLDKNVLILVPRGASLTTFIYTQMRNLSKYGKDLFPYMDLLEIGNTMNTVLKGYTKYPLITGLDPIKLFEVDVLFTRLPTILDVNLFNILSDLITRRSLRGKTTFIAGRQPYNVLIKYDLFGTFKQMIGDGTGDTLLKLDYFNQVSSERVVMEVESSDI